MIDGSELRDMMWDGRWDGIVMFAKGAWQASLVNPWMFVVWGLVLLSLICLGWMKLIRFVGGKFVRSHLR